MSNVSFTKKIVFNTEMIQKFQSFQQKSGKRVIYRVKGGKEILDGFLPSKIR